MIAKKTIRQIEDGDRLLQDKYGVAGLAYIDNVRRLNMRQNSGLNDTVYTISDEGLESILENGINPNLFKREFAPHLINAIEYLDNLNSELKIVGYKEIKDQIIESLMYALKDNVVMEHMKFTSSHDSDHDTYINAIQTAVVANVIAYHLDQDIDANALTRNALLHDYGKRFSASKDAVKTHTIKGHDKLVEHGDNYSDAAEVALRHHDRINNANISNEIQIIGMADLFSRLKCYQNQKCVSDKERKVNLYRTVVIEDKASPHYGLDAQTTIRTIGFSSYGNLLLHGESMFSLTITNALYNAFGMIGDINNKYGDGIRNQLENCKRQSGAQSPSPQYQRLCA